jgi:ABC-type nitrate/sulfonate/bicarbonate transport system permease component
MVAKSPVVIRRYATHALNAVLEVVMPVGLIALWWFASRHSSSVYYPPLSKIVTTLRQFWLFSHFGSDAVPTLVHLAIGFLIAVAVGIAMGTLLGLAPLCAEVVSPVLEFVRAIPVVAVLPAGLLILGIGPAFQVTVIAFGAVWPVLLNTMDGVRALDPIVVDVGRSFRISRHVMLFRVTLPAAMPNIVAGIRTSISIAVSVVIFSELMGATSGIGYQILQAQDTFAVPEVWAGVILLGVLGYLLNVAFRGLERVLLRQHRNMRETPR